jgi:small subunit ribosomal protein S10
VSSIDPCSLFSHVLALPPFAASRKLNFPENRQNGKIEVRERETTLAGQSNERIRIRMEGYDYEILDRTAKEILDTAERTGAEVHGPIPLPTRIERYTVLRSPHIDRKSREQFEIRTHKRLIDILKPTSKTIEALNKGLTLPPGVDIKIRVIGAGG